MLCSAIFRGKLCAVTFSLLFFPAAARAAPFVRGDVDSSGGLDITDPIRALGYLFLGSPDSILCMDAADANDSGELDISDPVYLLSFLFLGGSAPGAPFSGCGEDLTEDSLGCAEYPPCGSEVQILKGSIERDESPEVSPQDLAELASGNTAFALDLYRAVEGGRKNLLVSPYSISVALAMTYAGARGNTEVQMASALHFTLPQERLHPAFNALDLALESRSEAPAEEEGDRFQLNVANAIWGEKTWPFLTSFLDVLSENYGAGLRILDFIKAPEWCRTLINTWVSDETQGRIQDLLPPGSIDESTRLVLTNAIYFKASWYYPFDEAQTLPRTFTLRDGSEVAVPTMRATGPYRIAKGDGYEAAELMYLGEQLSMVILMPDAARFDEFESQLDAAALASILASMEGGWVDLSMPKFGCQTSLSLKETLIALGMTDAFTLAANFSGIDETGLLFIDRVLHKTFIGVDEKGTEAAAATAVIMPPIGIPEEIHINQPFLYLIRDIPTGTILFLGRVVDPAS
jgi:serpin B